MSQSLPDPASPSLRATVIGSAMIDIIAVIAPENIERITTQNAGASFLLLEQGRKIPAQGIETHIGGGGCNVAVSLARRGWDTRLLCKTGDDLNAGAVLEHLRRNGVDEAAVQRNADLATGVAVMIAAHDRNAAIFVHRGANEHLAYGDIKDAVFEGVDLVYIAPLSSASADCFSVLVEQGRWAGAMVAANPGIRQLTSRTDAFFSSMSNLDLLSVNAVEAAALVPGLIARGARLSGAGLPAEAPQLLRRGLSFGGHDLGLMDFFAGCHAQGLTWVLLTDGAHGAYLSGQNQVWYCPTAPAVVAGTAGAGDAFCSTLVSGLASGQSPEDALQHASHNAASVVEQINTTDGLLDASALAQAVEAKPLAVQRFSR
ncbi:MAG: carbohydrate kinase family protein [Neomegalonema sp.]|nr:carbohydrate kinase family protein [Neomegalonema sp.]